MSSTKPVVPLEVEVVNALPRTNNVSEPSRTQEALRASEIRYRRLFEAARDGIIILDAASLKITDVNPFMIELLGYSRDEFLGKELWEIGLFSDKEASQIAFREVQAKGYLRYEDLPLQTTKGRLREVEFVSNVYEEGTNKVIQCNIRDITNRKRSEDERRQLLESAQAAHAEAEKANNIKDEFLAVLSHELRTPLTAILGWSKMLDTGNLDELDSKRAIEIIMRNARAQSQLIEDLLDISRIITGKLHLEVQPLQLAPMIASVVDDLRPSSDARRIHLTTELDSGVSPISGDPERVKQILFNLLSNAIKFTPKGGRIEVRLERIHSHVELVISDTGQGIDPELLLHVFERFRQSDSSSTRRHGGLGIGLSIVRQLVEMHGGTVTCDSPGIGKGTTFTVIFPMMSVHEEIREVEMTYPVIAHRTLTNRQPSLAALRVLVVDDEPDACALVAAVLRERGAEVVAVESAGEALAAIKQQRFDVLVSDIGMPNMDGYELIGKIRQLPADRGGQMPAAALTAYAGVEHRMRVLSAGYQMHIPKPVEPAELTAVVASLAQRFDRSTK